jgi:hypothetical protein
MLRQGLLRAQAKGRSRHHKLQPPRPSPQGQQRCASPVGISNLRLL